ncbi:outer membrane protein [Helicobacter pametensis]|nr:outer membrane protein [Helicobacter pametensis]
MKKLKYSLVALLALGVLNQISAEEVQAEGAEQKTQEAGVDKSVPPSTKTSIMDALEGTTIGGYVYGQVTSMFGSDADGTAFRVRTMMDVNTGAYYGFSVGTRIFASMGGGAPNGGTFIQNSGLKPNYSPAGAIPVGLLALYGRATFESSATVITAGKINIAAPFADQGWDFGYGVSLDNYDVEGVGFHLQAYGAWGLDNGNSIEGAYNFINQSSEADSNIVSENPMFIFGISGDKSKLAGVGFDIWAMHVLDTVDFMTYLDLNYTIAGVKLQTQVATTQVNTSSRYFNHGGVSNDGTVSDRSAKLRGLYNVHLGYEGETSGVVASVGYTGSFGDGYGALLNYVGSFNMGGQIWWDTLSSGANGYGMTGVGGYKNANGQNSTIQVVYASLGYKGVKNLSMILDYAWISGNNNYGLMKKGIKNHAGLTNMNADFHEVTLSVKYAFTDKLSMTILGGSTFGDLQMGRARFRLNYSF